MTVSERRFELNWPVVVLVIVVLATGVAIFRPELVEFLTDQGVKVLSTLKGIFR